MSVKLVHRGVCARYRLREEQCRSQQLEVKIASSAASAPLQVRQVTVPSDPFPIIQVVGQKWALQGDKEGGFHGNTII